MNNQKYIKDIFKLVQSDSAAICRGRKFKIHDITLKDKFKSKRNVEILLYDGANYYCSCKDVNLKNCKMVIKLDGEIKYESDKGIFRQVESSYSKRGNFNWKEFIKLNTPDFKTVKIKSIDFSSKTHKNQYYTFRSLIACQMKLDNTLREFIQSNTYDMKTYNS